MEIENKGPLQGLIEASMLEFPMAMQKWMLGMGADSREVEDAVLKACQAWTNLANQSMERMFQAEGFVGLMTGSVKHFVQCQRVARDFIESMAPRPAMAEGGGDTAMVAELRETVSRLHREMRGLTARLNLVDRRSTTGAESSEPPADRDVAKVA
jgi:hypothetical protein